MINLDKNIINKSLEIKKNKKRLAINMDNLKNRLIHIYKHGDNTVLNDFILSDDLIRDINLLKYLPILIEADNDLKNETKTILNNLENDRIFLENSKLYRINKKDTLILKESSLKEDNIRLKGKIDSLVISKIKNIKDSTKLNDEIKKINLKIDTLELDISILEEDSDIKKNERELSRQMLDLLEVAKIRQKNKNKDLVDGSFDKMKGKLAWPINGKITEKFGMQTNIINNVKIPNIGIDIKPNNDNIIRSVFDGFISVYSYRPEYGNIIIIRHADEKYSLYTNINFLPGLKEDDFVETGDKIATIDNSKFNLHFGIWAENKKGEMKPENPEKWLKK